MPTYGDGPPGSQGQYDGSSDNHPATEEMVRSLYNFFGFAGGEVFGSAGPYVPKWLQNIMGNRLPTPAEAAAYLKAAADFGLGGFVTPSGWVDWTLALGDYARATHAAVTGTWNPRGLASGGGGDGFGADLTVPPNNQLPSIYQRSTGYGGTGLRVDQASAVLISDTVWQFPIVTWDPQGYVYSDVASTILADAGSGANFAVGLLGAPLATAAGFAVCSASANYLSSVLGNWRTPLFLTLPGPFDFALVRVDDTVLTYLVREQPSFAWTPFGPWPTIYGTGWVWAQDPNYSLVWYRCVYTDHDLATMGPGGGAAAAQGWPGIDAVVLGTPIPFTTSARFEAVCDGLLLTFTTLPPGQGRQLAGDVTRYPTIGWLAFITDNGDAEPLQYLGIDRAVYVPQAMAQAAGVAISCKPGLTGTIVPWTRL